LKKIDSKQQQANLLANEELQIELKPQQASLLANEEINKYRNICYE